MRKKILILLFAIATSVETMFAWDYYGVPIGDFEYNLDATNQTAEIIGITNISDFINIPTNVTYNAIPYSVTSIGYHAFYEIPGVISVTIPNSVTSIETRAFEYCFALTSFNVAADNPNYSSEGGILFDKDQTTLIQYPESKLGTSYTIPSSVTSIGNYAFEACSALISIEIPNSVTSIGDYAFEGCTGLTSVVWNAANCLDFSSINTPFYYKNRYDLRAQLTSFVFGDEVEYIPAYLCNGMNNVSEIIISNCKTIIGTNALLGCNYKVEGVYNIILPDTALCYGEELYIDGVKCDLEKGVNYTQNWTRNLNSIEGCDSVVTISVMWRKLYEPNEIYHTDCYDTPNSGSISYYFSPEPSHGYDYYTLNGVKNAPLTNLRAGNYRLAFHNDLCEDSIVKNVEIKQYAMNVNGIYYNFIEEGNNRYAEVSYRGTSYADCAGMSYDGEGRCGEYFGNVIIPDSVYWDGQYWIVTAIGEDAFRETNVESVTIPSSVKTIKAHAFYNCSKLSYIELLSSECNLVYADVRIGSSSSYDYTYGGLVFQEYYGNYYTHTTKFLTTIPIYVPVGSLDYYISNYPHGDRGVINFHIFKHTDIKTISGATSAAITLGNSDNQNHIVSCGIEGSEMEFVGNNIEYNGLEPNKNHEEIAVFINTKEGDHDTLHCSFATTALELTTQPSKPVSSTTAILLANTNMADIETSCGFEWKRNDAPADMDGIKAYCPVANGTMAGRLKGLNENTYYKYRAFYQSSAGNMYYGDWQYIFTGDNIVEFEPILYTYEAVSVKENEATLKGYALAGSDDFTEQGFEYWAESRVQQEGRMSRRVSAALGEHKTITASGISMKATLTGLDAGTVYKYRTYAKLGNQTIYGSEMSFTTKGEYTGSEDIDNIPCTPVVSSRKILRNGQILIFRGEKTYTIQGQVVK